MILFRNCKYLSKDGTFEEADILVNDGIIASIGHNIQPDINCEIIDASGYKIIPGLIDIHIHGAIGYDVMTANPEQINEMGLFLAKSGTTTFLPTTITASMEDTCQALENIKTVAKINNIGAYIAGVHIEGPYISPKQLGCHDVSLVKKPDISEFERFRDILGNDIKIHMTIAPELDDGFNFTNHVIESGASISIGHSNADARVVQMALQNGINCFTHLFNAMKGIHHREPGVAGAALVSNAFVELICDGAHVHPDIIKMIYNLKGSKEIVLMTDAMHATGLGDGQYFFGGAVINVVNGISRNESGALASSTLTMHKAMKNIIKFLDVPLEDAVRMATINPAKVIGIDNIVGSIEVGKQADILILDESLNINAVYCKGIKVN